MMTIRRPGGPDGVVPSETIRFAACPVWGLFDGARWSMNGTTCQSVARPDA